MIPNPSTTTVLDSNFLSPIRFVFIIDTPEFENIAYHCQTVSLPTLSAPSIDVPFRQLNSARMTSSALEFGEFNARFIIEEDMNNYIKIYEWMISTVNGDQGDKETDVKKDVSILIYNNNNLLNKKIQLISAFPTSLSAVDFDVTLADTQYLYADITMAIDYYVFRDSTSTFLSESDPSPIRG